MKVLIAPNAFKGSLTAAEAAAAIVRGLRRALPRISAELLPIADGGDGLLEALAPSLGGRVVRSRIEGPLGRKVEACWLLAGRTAVIEMAEAAGLRRLRRRPLLPLDASTRGVGQLMSEAVRRGAAEIIVGLGGSASNDGGAGCAQAFGFSLLDARGREICRGARGLAALDKVVPGRAAGLAGKARVIGLADVTNPLCGRLGSARVFGPQKGAGRRQVLFMERALLNYADVLEKSLGRDVSLLRGGAAAGGLGAGLAAFFGARLEDGAGFVLKRTGFHEALGRADVLVTGEGRFDRQTFYGKAPGAAVRAAAALGKPAAVLCGQNGLGAGRAASLGVSMAAAAGRHPSPARALERASASRLAPFIASLAS